MPKRKTINRVDEFDFQLTQFAVALRHNQGSVERQNAALLFLCLELAGFVRLRLFLDGLCGETTAFGDLSSDYIARLLYIIDSL